MIGDLCNMHANYVFHFNSIVHWWEPFEANPDLDYGLACICIQLINCHPCPNAKTLCVGLISCFPKTEIVINSI